MQIEVEHAMPTQTLRGNRRWFQFGLKSLMLLIVVCAVALAWWRQRGLIEQLNETRDELRQYQDGVEYYELTSAVPMHSIVTIPAKRKRSRAWSGFCFLVDLGSRRHKAAKCHREAGGAARGTPFSAPCIRHSGTGLAMIMHYDEDLGGSRVIDVVEFTFHRSADYARLEDVDGDGVVELVIELEAGSDGGSSAQTLVYSIGKDGFRLRGPAK